MRNDLWGGGGLGRGGCQLVCFFVRFLFAPGA